MTDTPVNDTVYSLSAELPGNDSSCGYNDEISEVTHILRRVVFMAILVFGLAGNGAVLLLIAFIRELRTATSAYLVVLCGANVLILLTYLPVLLAEVEFNKLSVPLANWLSFELRFHCTVSILTLIILSFERWKAVVKPMNIQTDTSTALTVKLSTLFISAVIITLPYAFVHIPVEEDESVQNTLWRDMVLFLTYYSAIVLYLIPLAIIATLYVSMAIKLLSNGGNIRETIRRHKKTRARRSKVARVVLGLVLSFAFCWLPFNLFYIVGVYELHCTFPEFTKVLQIWMTAIFLLNTCTDPLSIFLLGSRFRVHLIGVLRLRRFCGNTAEQHMYRGTWNGCTQSTYTPDRKSSNSNSMRLKSLQVHIEDMAYKANASTE